MMMMVSTYSVWKFVDSSLEDVLVVRFITQRLHINQSDLVLRHVMDVTDMA